MDIRVVRQGSPQYWDSIELRRRVLRFPLGLDYTQEQLEAEAGETVFLAYDGDDIVGSLSMRPQNCSVVKMRQVAVDDQLQGKGIGRALVAACEKWARENNYSQIELHARQVALPFYERLNYRIVGEPFEEVGIPHRKMSKDLEPGV